MANLVVKSKTASNSFDIQQKVFQMPFTDSKVELIITPRKSRIINAGDFNVAALPSAITSVNFENLGSKVIAIINFNKEISSSRTVVINVPIYGTSVLKRDSFKIIQTENIIGDVLINSNSSFPKSIIGGETTYNISNNLGVKTLVLVKTFSVSNNFKFSKIPTYTISGNANRYQVITEFTRNNKKEIISKTFKFYYTSPAVLTSSIDTTIVFTVNTNGVTPLASELKSTNNKENKIYSINQGVDPGSLGGNKRITVKGVPGSTFKFLVSNSNGEIYDQNAGAFTNDGSIISGIIPNAVEGSSYGESIIRVNVPRSSTSQTISTKFIKDEDAIVQTARREAAIANAIALGDAGDISQAIKQAQSDEISVTKEVVSLTTPIITLGVTMGDFLGPSVKVVNTDGETTSTNQVYLGNEGRVDLNISKIGIYPFKFILTSTGRIQIVRQPIFTMPEIAGTDNFVVDGGTPSTAQKLAKLASDGSTSIVSDWNWTTVRENTNIAIATQIKGSGKHLATESVSGTTLYSYSQVEVYGEITVNNVGALSDSIALNLNNFLTRKDV